MDINPWRVESIQEFVCFKCPECDYFNTEEIYFEDHAISNHPLSSVLFDRKHKTKTIRSNEVNIKEEVVDNVDHVIVGDIKKEPSEIINDAENDPFDLSDPQYSIHQERENLTMPVDPTLLYTEESEPMEPKTEPNEQKNELQIPFIPENKYKMQNTTCNYCNKTFPSPSSRKSHMVTCAIETEKRYQSKKNNKKRYRKASENELQALVISQTHPVVTLEILDTSQTDPVVSNTLQTDPVLSNSTQETSNESSTTGQLISKCLFGVDHFDQNTNKNF